MYKIVICLAEHVYEAIIQCFWTDLQDVYQLKGLYPEDWSDLINRMKTNETLFQQYYKYVYITLSVSLPLPLPPPQLFVYHFFGNPAVYATLQVPHVTGGRTIHSHKCVIIYSWSRRQHMAVQSVTSLKITTLCIYTMLHAVFLDSWIPLTVSK